MTFDDGTLNIYNTENIAPAGEKPITGLVYKSSHFFGYETIGMTRHYTAKQAHVIISDIVHVWQDRNIKSGDICILEDGLQYKCELVQHVLNEDGLPITRITLERLGEEYVLRENI